MCDIRYSKKGQKALLTHLVLFLHLESYLIKLSYLVLLLLSQIQIDILRCPITFHLVENDFPIPQNGILGSDFFKQFQAKINYYLLNLLNIKSIKKGQ